mmetsp:Transcript_67530/g.175844  ORF Transcript_67530/g.175844 Transcript_67530/m.175844 type:complete len:261 (-) Transcript_67530:59-841(-)
MVVSRAPGRLRSAFRGKYSMTRSAAAAASKSSASPPAALQSTRCQKAITTEVQMGSVIQHSWISRRTFTLSAPPLKELGARNTALAAVAQLQLAPCSRISPRTSPISRSPSRARSGSGLCHTSAVSPLISTVPSPSSPMRTSLELSGATCRSSSASWRPLLARVLSTVRTFQISDAPGGHTSCRWWASSVSSSIFSGGSITSMTWPIKPPLVPSSHSPPGDPCTKSTSPGTITPAMRSSSRLFRAPGGSAIAGHPPAGSA